MEVEWQRISGNKADRLSRHGLVMATWALRSSSLLCYSTLVICMSNWWFVAAFTAIVVAFCAHIIVNVVFKTGLMKARLFSGAILVCLTIVYFITILVAPDASVERLIMLVSALEH